MLNVQSEWWLTTVLSLSKVDLGKLVKGENTIKISKSFEQAICILYILAVQKNHEPLPSKLVSQRLEISDSYSKKIVRKLVEAQLITSATGKSGGLALQKPLKEISLLDIYFALEEKHIFFSTHLSEKVFLTPEKVEEREAIVMTAVRKAEDAFYQALSEFFLDEALYAEDTVNGYIDWKKILENLV
jgi:Rrf2 family protein